jgi:hypothetical protein
MRVALRADAVIRGSAIPLVNNLRVFFANIALAFAML